MKTILVVDDEEMIRHAIALALSRRGFQVLEAGSGQAAFDLVKAQPFCLVISDIRMPNGDGIELARRLRAEIEIPPAVILISGFSEEPPEKLSPTEVYAFLQKPFDFQELFRLVIEASEGR